jgi:hypothetical protein
LVKGGIIKGSQKSKVTENGKKISIDNESSLIIESGVGLARYLIALRAAIAVNHSFIFLIH